MSYELFWDRQPVYVVLAPTFEERTRRQEEMVSYLDVGFYAMEELRQQMDQLGMLANVERPEFPDHEAFGLTEHPGRPWSFETEDPSVLAFWEAEADWFGGRPEIPGIAVYKLMSNDEWYVTPEEIREALDAIGDQPQPDDENWRIWLRFLCGALEHDGFNVI